MYKNNELYHHGILGQKWGVRRYQNDDGSLTEEGRARYGVGSSKKTRSSASKYAKDLNKTDAIRANKQYEYDYAKNKEHNYSEKAKDRIYTTGNSFDKKASKLKAKAALQSEKAKIAFDEKTIWEGRQKALRASAELEGYKVTSKKVVREARQGYELMAYIFGGSKSDYVLGSWLADIVTATPNKMSGEMYRVRKPRREGE